MSKVLKDVSLEKNLSYCFVSRNRGYLEGLFLEEKSDRFIIKTDTGLIDAIPRGDVYFYYRCDSTARAV